MSILWRSWLSVTAILGLVLAILSALMILQHNATLASLLKQRLGVIALSTSNAFRPIVNMGLPLGMLRNANDVLAHARNKDPNIRQIFVIEADGAIIYSSPRSQDAYIDKPLYQAMKLQDNGRWSAESDAALVSAVSIPRRDGTIAGWIVAIYDKEAFTKVCDALQVRITKAFLLAWLSFSGLAWCILRLQLAGAIRDFGSVKSLLAQFSSRLPDTPAPTLPKTEVHGLFGEEIKVLHQKLIQAEEQYYLRLNHSSNNQCDSTCTPSTALDATRHMVKQAPDSPAARAISRRVLPSLTIVLLCAVFAQGWYAFSQVRSSFEPEQAERVALIGSVASSNIQRAISAGVPLQGLVGVERYFNELLQLFPEVSYLSVIESTRDDPVVEAGNHMQGSSGLWGVRLQNREFPILSGNTRIGHIEVEANPHYFAMQLRFLLLDIAVVLLIAILLAYQVLIVTLSFSMTGPFNRLGYLLDLQAAGDFSADLGTRARTELDQAAAFLSKRARVVAMPAPKTLQFAYLNDIRLPLFFCGMTDALSISFLPVYTRIVENPLSWIDTGIVLSLPLAGYLLANTIGAPCVRALISHLGFRNLLILATTLILLANLGLSQAASTIALIIFRTLSGFGYALATNACQDYVLHVAPKAMRAKSLGLFTSALFAGIFTGAAAGGIIADRSGAPAVFLVGALIALVAGAFVWTCIPNNPGNGAAKIPHVIDLVRPLENIRFLLLVACIAVPSNIMIQAFIAFIVALQFDALGASAAEVARVVMLYFLSVMTTVSLSSRLFESRIKAGTLALTGLITAAVSLGITAIWPDYWGMVGAVVAVGIGQGLIRDPEVSIAIRLAERDELKAVGEAGILSSLRVLERGGSIIGLLAIAFLAGEYGYPFAIACISIWLIAGALVLLLAGHMRRISF
ncbi:MAG: MFS transporter [Oceanospirillales bacterium]|nr:MFS transporter [Oceanospirillales bacterium]